jgi:Zn-dependent protease with chaperone function
MMAWVLEFLLQSTLWLGLAGLSTRMLPRLHPQTRETIWYTAILASLIGPTVHILNPGGVASLWTLSVPGGFLSLLGIAPVGGVTASTGVLDSTFPTWGMVLGGIWLLVSGLLIFMYLGRMALIRPTLSRTDLGVGSSPRLILSSLSRKAGLRRPPRLTQSEKLGSPIAFGLGRRAEVCVPARALRELDQGQLEVMLGHELAHHIRWDPLRLTALNLARGVFFFQPLLRTAWHEVRLASEEQCDAWASEVVGDPVVMARCLTEVAGWVLPGDRGMPFAGLTRGRSQLVRRVNRLLEGNLTSKAPGAGGRGLAALLVLVLAPWLAPGVLPESGASMMGPIADHPSESMPQDGEGEEHRGDGGNDEDRSGGEHEVGREGDTDGEHGAQGGDESGEDHRAP